MHGAPLYGASLHGGGQFLDGVPLYISRVHTWNPTVQRGQSVYGAPLYTGGPCMEPHCMVSHCAGSPSQMQAVIICIREYICISSVFLLY